VGEDQAEGAGMSRRLVELLEYQPKMLPASTLSEAVAKVLWQNYRDTVELELPDFRTEYQWKITSLGYVGFIPISDDLGLALRPKVGLTNLFGMMEYAYQLDLKMMDGVFDCATLEEFYERLANVLAKRILNRQRKGLYRSYISESDVVGFVRGRIDVDDAVRRPWNVNRKCNFEEHTADVEDNRILLWTMRCIAQSGLCSERVMPAVRSCYRALQGAAALQQFNFSDCIGRLYNRLNDDYEVLHGLCRFFLEQSGPLHSTGDHTMFPFLIDMAHLFELFVAEWLREHLPEGYTLQIQANVNLSETNRLKFIIDLVICDLETGRTLCVLDTKYKCPDTPTNDDISQVVTYAEIKGCSEAILVYPHDLDVNLDERLGDIRVRNLTFKIDGDLEAAGKAFLAKANLKALRSQPALISKRSSRN
jgi:5-methylcytosine-specific restriction enzyme subunit McrC